jgi:hypothetical protein
MNVDTDFVDDDDKSPPSSMPGQCVTPTPVVTVTEAVIRQSQVDICCVVQCTFDGTKQSCTMAAYKSMIKVAAGLASSCIYQ